MSQSGHFSTTLGHFLTIFGTLLATLSPTLVPCKLLLARKSEGKSARKVAENGHKAATFRHFSTLVEAYDKKKGFWDHRSRNDRKG